MNFSAESSGFLAMSSFSCFSLTSRYFSISSLSYGVSLAFEAFYLRTLSLGSLKLNPLKKPFIFYKRFLIVVSF
jgi:hypothetical protein